MLRKATKEEVENAIRIPKRPSHPTDKGKLTDIEGNRYRVEGSEFVMDNTLEP